MATNSRSRRRPTHGSRKVCGFAGSASDFKSHARWECLPLAGFPFWTSFQRFDSPGHVEVNDRIKLRAEPCIKIMTPSFSFWPIYNADRSLQQGFWYLDKAALTIIQN